MPDLITQFLTWGPVQYIGLVTIAAAFEFSYVRWASAVSSRHPVRTVCWSVCTGALSIFGLKGALSLELGEITYLAGIALGASAGAWLDRPRPGKPGP